MSLRVVNRGLDLNVILRELVPKYGGTGGGLPLAAGARVPREAFIEFLMDLAERVGTVSKD